MVSNAEYARRWRATEVGRIKTSLAQSAVLAKRGGYAPCKATFEEVIAARVKRCPICQRTKRKMVMDHCHKTGRFRGWICQPCNGALGMLRDDPNILSRAIRYLQ